MRYPERRKLERSRSKPLCRLDNTGPGRHTARVASRDLKRLSKAVTQRRTELSLTQEQFAARAGEGGQALSVKALQRLENGLISAPRPKTLGAIDRAAGWPAGRASAVWEGEYIPEVAEAVEVAESSGEPDPADFSSELEYQRAVYWYLRRGKNMSHEGVMRGFQLARAIFEEENRTERNAPNADGKEVG